MMTRRSVLTLTLTCLVLVLLHQCPRPVQGQGDLVVGAFNVQIFGVSKMDEPEVVEVLKKIIVRYDILLIQEIRDASDTAIHELMDQVNSMGQGTYEMMLSERLGRTQMKEQYAFFYKKSTVGVKNSYQWPDVGDVFEREPYIVHFTPLDSSHGVGDFAFLAIHAKPDDAVAENDALFDVYESVSDMWGMDEMLIGGDFNADCSYISDSDWDHIRFRQDSRFQWTIGDDADTTVSSTDCAYDRMVLVGAGLRNNYVQGSGVVHRFDLEQDISYELTLDTSDHYPTDIKLS